MEIVKRYSGVLVKHDDKVLLCKRNNEGSLPGAWSIPAGKINNGESPYDGAIREFYEETNIKPETKLKLVIRTVMPTNIAFDFFKIALQTVEENIKKRSKEK